MADVEQNQEEVCSICLEPLTNDNTVVLPCNHGFHTNCINDWTNSRRKILLFGFFHLLSIFEINYFNIENQQQQNGIDVAPCPLCRKQVEKDVIQELARPMDWVDLILTPFIVVIWSGQMLVKAPKNIYHLLVAIANKTVVVC